MLYARSDRDGHTERDARDADTDTDADRESVEPRTAPTQATVATTAIDPDGT
jgi:hypothetical protein